MKKTIKISTSLFLSLMLCALLALPTAAADAGFTVNPLLPENQWPETSGYFDLVTEPGQAQSLTVEISNNSGEDMTVTVEAITASTNMNGLLNYSSPGEMDESLVHAFADLVEVEEAHIAVPAGSSRQATVALTMPDTPIEGVLLGSIQVTKDLTDADKASGNAIVNQYSYVIGVRIRQDNAAVAPDFAMGGITTALTNHRASVTAAVRNIRPVLIKGANARAAIYPKGSGEAMLQRELETADIAPNSILPFTLIDNEGKGLQPGDYTASVRLEYEGQVWEFTEDFVIQPEQAAAINQEAVNLETPTASWFEQIPLWALIAITVGVVLVVLAAMILALMIKRTKRQAA